MTVEECGPIDLPLPEDEEFIAVVNRLIDQFLRGRGPRKAARDKLLAYGRRTVPILITRRHDPEMTIRWEVVNCGGYIADARQVPSICDSVMNDRNPHIRWRGMWALTEFKDRSPVHALLKNGLESPGEFARWNAAVALTMVGSRASLERIHEGLTWKDGWRRWEAINALQRINSAASAELLIPIFRDGEDRHRQEASMALGKIRTLRAAEILMEYALKDRKAGVRWRACDGLSGCRSQEAIPVLQELAKSDRDPQVRKRAAAAVARIRSGR